MDETNDETTPAGEEATVVEEHGEEATAERERGKGRCGCLCGLLSGSVVGGVLALLLAPMRHEERARREMVERGRWESREGLEEEGRLRAQVAVERVQVVAGGVASRVVAAWTAIKERFRDAVEEGKEGIAEGQEEARARYDFMTKRRRPRR